MPALALLLCSTCLLWTTAAPSYSSAAPIATPTPGTATQLTAPAPDPAQFDFSAQQVLTHQALNSDIYGPWYEFFSLIGALNATGAGAYACGPCITSLSNGTGISATLGAQSSGVGVNATIGLSHGDYVDVSSAQAITGAKTFSQIVTSTANGFDAAPASSQGVYYFGAIPNQYIDYGINNPGKFTVVGGDLVEYSRILANANGAVSYVAPVYTPSGSAVASTVHTVLFSQSVTLSGSCAAYTNCAISSGGSVALSGAATFTSGTSYACGFSPNGSSFALIASNVSSGASTINLQIFNAGSTAATGTVTINGACTGT